MIPRPATPLTQRVYRAVELVPHPQREDRNEVPHPRFILVPALHEELEVLVPEDRGDRGNPDRPMLSAVEHAKAHRAVPRRNLAQLAETARRTPLRGPLRGLSASYNRSHPGDQPLGPADRSRCPPSPSPLPTLPYPPRRVGAG
ncbi:hypothetical protein GCM10010425_43230 [Streptomyces spororaveus]|uniref:Uncharacterized protein n=1 Tax=Streptomyces spororaveus TaxID=284039 RepID=A0ABQ3TMN0_9ACTN|nr:hypothetical protein Sspor_72450 [Streptomyces spororaveus]